MLSCATLQDLDIAITPHLDDGVLRVGVSDCQAASMYQSFVQQRLPAQSYVHAYACNKITAKGKRLALHNGMIHVMQLTPMLSALDCRTGVWRLAQCPGL